MGRNLRVFLIDDRPVTNLETRHLQLQPVPYASHDEFDPSLGTWYQHLRMWSDNLFPSENPDLILIDCRFEADSHHVPLSDELRENDPRGLLHGAIYIARMFGRDRFHPFGFAVYSMDASRFKDDAYAQTLMGFLLAMRDSTREEGAAGSVRGRSAREVVPICGEELGRTVCQNPATAWEPALRMYRERLKEVFEQQAYVVDSESWLRAIDAVRREDTGQIEAGLDLGWRRLGGEPDRVFLKSLFADVLDRDAWGPKANSIAEEWLDSLLVMGDYLQEALEWVHKVVEEGQEPEELPVREGRDVRGYTLKKFFHACLAVVGWFESRSQGPRLSSGNVLRQIGLVDQQMARFFRPQLGLPWGKVVDLLDQGVEIGVWPFPGQWELRLVLRDWCVNIRNQKFPFRALEMR